MLKLQRLIIRNQLKAEKAIKNSGTSSRKISYSHATMNHFKSIKNYLSNSVNNNSSNNIECESAPAVSTNSSSNSPELSEDASSPSPSSSPLLTPSSAFTGSKPTYSSKLTKSLNESTKRISNLFQLSNKSADTTIASASPTLKPVIRSKFLRSNTTARLATPEDETSSQFFNVNSDNNNRSLNNSLTKKQLLHSEHLSPESIFQTLSADLDKLAKYFEQQAAGQALLDYSNFIETADVTPVVYFSLMRHAQELLRSTLIVYNQVEINAIFYDFDHALKSSGYRSLLRTFENCCRRTLLVLYELNEKKSRIGSSLLPVKLMSKNLREVQTWIRLLEKMEIVLQLGLDMQTRTLQAFKRDINHCNQSNSDDVRREISGPTLFVHAIQLASTPIEKILFDLATVHQEAFYGRTCGFQFCDSLTMPLTGCAIALTSYNDGYEAFSGSRNDSSSQSQSQPLSTSSTFNTSPSSVDLNLFPNSQSYSSNLMSTATIQSSSAPLTPITSNLNMFTTSIGQAAMSVFSSTKYLIDPDLRSRKMAQIFKTANVEFCKAFWQLTETSIVQVLLILHQGVILSKLNS